MRTTVAILNKPNHNGRVYTKESFVEFSDIILITLGVCESPEIPLDKVIGRATDFLFEDDKLTCEIESFEVTPSSKLAKLLMETDKYTYVIGGIGNYKDSYIENYKLTHLSFIKECESSFKDM